MSKFLTVFCVLILSGCASSYLPKPITTQYKGSDGKAVEKIDVSTLTSAKYDGANNKGARNEIISIGLTLSDRQCSIHKAEIMANANNWNVGLGSASMILAGAASVIDSTTTVSHLAAGAATITGIQALGNKEVYANALSTTILRAIDVSRAKTKARIMLGMDKDDYSIALAIVDIQEYHDSCSLMSGLVEVTKALENRKPSTEELDLQIATLKKNIATISTTTTTTPPATTIPPATTTPPATTPPATTGTTTVTPTFPINPEVIKKLQELQAEKIRQRAETFE